jgi:hypothetical protein
MHIKTRPAVITIAAFIACCSFVARCFHSSDGGTKLSLPSWQPKNRSVVISPKRQPDVGTSSPKNEAQSESQTEPASYRFSEKRLEFNRVAKSRKIQDITNLNFNPYPENRLKGPYSFPVVDSGELEKYDFGNLKEALDRAIKDFFAKQQSFDQETLDEVYSQPPIVVYSIPAWPGRADAVNAAVDFLRTAAPDTEIDELKLLFNVALRNISAFECIHQADKTRVIIVETLPLEAGKPSWMVVVGYPLTEGKPFTPVPGKMTSADSIARATLANFGIGVYDQRRLPTFLNHILN